MFEKIEVGMLAEWLLHAVNVAEESLEKARLLNGSSREVLLDMMGLLCSLMLDPSLPDLQLLAQAFPCKITIKETPEHAKPILALSKPLELCMTNTMDVHGMQCQFLNNDEEVCTYRYTYFPSMKGCADNS